MLRRMSRYPSPLVALVVALTWTVVGVHGQSGAKNGEWRWYGGDAGHTRYSPLDQINASNFSKLDVAWRFKTEHLGPRPEFKFESTPLMVNGVLYSTAGTRRAVVALDADTGEDAVGAQRETKARAARRRHGSSRAAAWRTGPTASEERILYVTPGYQLVALNAKTGMRVPTFGNNGIVDLKQDDDQEIDPMSGEIGLHSTPMVAGNVVIVGAAHRSGSIPTGKTNVKGYVRGFDVRTGKRLWIFHTIPQPGEFGNDTWLNDSWSYTGNTGVVGADQRRRGARHRLPAGRELPTGDYFGGRSARQQSVRREPRRGRPEDRQAQVALPAGASRHLGQRHPVRADPGGHHRQRPDDQGGRAADQAGVPVRVRSRDRRADLADRRAAGAEGRRAGRMVFADAAVPARSARQAVHYDAQGFVGRRSDRLHARAARRRHEGRRRSTRSGRSSRHPS